MYRRHILARFRLYSRRSRKFFYHNVLHADDPPHRLALGAAIGVFVAFMPAVGFQMMINFFLAWLLREQGDRAADRMDLEPRHDRPDLLLLLFCGAHDAGLAGGPSRLVGSLGSATAGLVGDNHLLLVAFRRDCSSAVAGLFSHRTAAGLSHVLLSVLSGAQ